MDWILGILCVITLRCICFFLSYQEALDCGIISLLLRTRKMLNKPDGKVRFTEYATKRMVLEGSRRFGYQF
ncbi:hypothetical protein L228DRAFT_249762 [Xylona heveae TC161]|uniref:Uncharacterized protein n=1 Tax=Xylona heveae (strain CBS 132557 / TC161) TaxID=1328760 RepID=A0A165FFV7_XYLHT|nr:hypothetical protein L228DRAFT_249762 [Xylona heveae TC161]KZF20927.1 hypothetical protein L228DRAFT_249762 [Xylona heveae TC161]